MDLLLNASHGIVLEIFQTRYLKTSHAKGEQDPGVNVKQKVSQTVKNSSNQECQGQPNFLLTLPLHQLLQLLYKLKK